MNKVAHGVVLAFFGMACWLVWGLLRLSGNVHNAWFRGIDNGHEVRELIQQRFRRLCEQRFDARACSARALRWVSRRE